jgi:TrmH family RNA methyltransferase
MAGNLLTLIRDLHRRKARERRGLVVAEGRRLVADVLASGAQVRGILASDAAPPATLDPILAAAAQRGVAVERVPQRDFDALADTDTPSGVLAVIEWQPRPLAGMPAGDGLLLVLDGVRDPGNVGTMIRTAFALGALGTIALDGTADVRSAKVARGSMGALFRHPVAAASFDELLAWLTASGARITVAALDGGPVEPGAATGRRALVVGSEAHGTRDAWRAVAGAARVSIPMREGAESLNASVAAGILLFELMRSDS